MNPASIFISIAAYREFDLPETLRSLFTMADDVSRLSVCICWQRGADESLGEWADNPRIQLIDVPYRESRGVCWARHRIQQEYRDERYFLQLDGHHRCVAGWDTQLVDMLEGLRDAGVTRPVLTTYLPAFDPGNDPAGRSQDLWLLGVDRFDDSGVLFMRPYIPVDSPESPVPTRFWSAHFSFSDGTLVRDVPIDPQGYFHGEEIGTCVRAWTSGYDFYSPHRTLLWHEYSRKGRRCHWDDHDNWMTRNGRALSRYARLVGLDGVPRENFGRYGLGRERSLADYERFAGVSFSKRHIEADTLAHLPPRRDHESSEDSQAEPSEVTRIAAPHQATPARSPGWTSEQLDGELVLYNPDSTRACYLNDTAALVWHLVDGARTTEDICTLLADAYAEVPDLASDIREVLVGLRAQNAIVY